MIPSSEEATTMTLGSVTSNGLTSRKTPLPISLHYNIVKKMKLNNNSKTINMKRKKWPKTKGRMRMTKKFDCFF
jgi:hypothetical protein